MKQTFQALAVLFSLALALPVAALGLGKLEHDSALNERFEARLPLLSATADELSTLKVGLADETAFRRANVTYSPALSQLRFKLVEPASGNEYIRITSDQPISEPFLNFLVELSWGSGRIYREYTVLLDPPLYDPNPTRTATADRREPSSNTAEPVAESPAPEKYSHTVNYPDQQPVRPAPSSARISSYSDGDYGPVQPGATLWSIANEMRPSGVTTQQMMLALLRANPNAFIGNNINALKSGAILQMPDDGQINAISASRALTEVEDQHALWQQMSQSVAANPAQRADSVTPSASPSADNESVTAATEERVSESESRLELVAAATGNANQQSGDSSGADEASQQLTIVNEQLESVQQENAELQDRLRENEALIEDLKRLIALKDDELAALQDGSMQDSAAVSDEGGPAASTPLQQDGHTVNYPNGDPAQFINTDPGPTGTAPVAAESAPVELSHTVNYPNGEPQAEAPVAGPTGDTEAAAEATATDPEPATAEAPAADTGETAELQDDGLMATLAAMVGSVRALVMNNLMIAGGALLALIALLAGVSFMRRRQQAVDSDVEAVMTADEFSNFTASSDLQETTFENDSASATQFNVALDEDESPTELNADVVGNNDADLFVVPEGEGPDAVGGQQEAEDPLAEVNVLMAYEHFDQAESFVRNALKSEPDNVEYHAKLLEVFYAAGNKKKYEETASDLRDLTGGRGEEWDMAVAMWQEMSPNRALFEGGGEQVDDEDELGASTGGGIVDITSDTATAGGGTSGGATGAGIDFDLGDSTGGGSHGADDGGEMLDLTASQGEDHDDGMLDLTANSQEDDEPSDMLDLSSSNASMDALDDTRTMTQSELGQGSPEQSDADNSLDFSLDGVGGSDLLDVTHSGEVNNDDDLLDLTSSGNKTEQEDDLDFSLDGIDSGDAEATESDEDNMLEFTTDMSDLTEDSNSALEFETEADAEPASDSNFDSLDLQIESYDDSADLDEIGEELDRLEQTLGTLSRQDTTKSGYSNTSDALAGIDNALSSEQEAANSELEDIESEFGLSLEDDEAGVDESVDDDLSAFSLDLDSEDTEVSLEDDESGVDDDLSAFSLDLDSEDTEVSLEDDEADVDDDLSALSIELDSEADDTSFDSLDEGDAEINLEPGGDEGALAFDSSDDLESEIDDTTGSADDEIGEEDLSLDTVQMDAVKTEDPSAHDFDLDTMNDDSLANIDMDSTVELPKQRLGNGLSLDESDEDEDENTLFVARSGNTDEQSLEDELMTKLDLAKAYVELGDSESARSILEEVMQDGNDNQKHQAGELLQQL